MLELQRAIERIAGMDAQVRTEVIRGVQLRRKENGIPVLSIHYSADPDRDPETETGKAWFERARGKYPSQSAWDREQEMRLKRPTAVPIGEQLQAQLEDLNLAWLVRGLDRRRRGG